MAFTPDEDFYYFDKITVLTDDKQNLQYFAQETGYAPERWKMDEGSGRWELESTLPEVINGFLTASATPQIEATAEIQSDLLHFTWEDGSDLYFKWRATGSTTSPIAFLPLPITADNTYVGIKAGEGYWELPMRGKNWGQMIADYWYFNTTPDGTLDFDSHEFRFNLEAQDLRWGIEEWMPTDREAFISALTALDDTLSEGDVLKLFDSFQFRIHTIIPNLIAFRQDLWHTLASALLQ